jgi:DNA polymerase-3 subunit epsilon
MIFKRLFKPKLLDDDRLNQYHTLSFQIPKSSLIKDHDFIVFDCETNGLHTDAALVSIGAVRLSNQRISIKDALDIQFEIFENNAQSQIHGALGYQETTELKEGLVQFLAYIGNATLVGLSVSMDIQWLNASFKKLGIPLILRNENIDIIHLLQRTEPERFRNLVGGVKGLDLDSLCKDFHIEIENRHTALGDAYMTAQLFMKLLAQLEKRGVTTMGDLLKKPRVI